MPSDTKRFRAFCAFDHKGRAPGCGWEGFTDSEATARQKVAKHNESHHADYERWDDEIPDRASTETER